MNDNMITRRRIAHGSSTGEQRLQAAAVRTVAAHMAVQDAAAAVNDALDQLTLSDQIDCGADDSILFVIERAKRSVSG